MKKKAVRISFVLMLASVILLNFIVPIWAIDIPTDILYTTGREHSYDQGIVDGATYYLRNLYHGSYMDVDNGSTANGTTVSTYTYHGGLNQQFKMFYLGNGLYEIIPVQAGTRLTVNASGRLTIDAKNQSSNQIFKIKMQSPDVGIILSESSNYTKALYWNSSAPNQVIEKTYNSATWAFQGQWIFERVGTSADMYRTYNVRNCKTGAYLEVYGNGTTAGTSIYGREYTGASNQQWVVRYNATNGSYTMHPGHRRDLALDYTNSNLVVGNDGNISTQGLVLIDSGQTDAHGRTKYKIQFEGTSLSQYLNIGEYVGVDSTRYTIEKGYSATDYWVFEEVVVDAKTVQLLATNQWQASSVVRNYGETKWFAFAATQNSRYKIELTGLNVMFGVVQGVVAPDDLGRTADYRNLDIIDIFMYGGGTPTNTAGAEQEIKCVYYIPVVHVASAKNNAEESFSVRIRQLSFVGHSDDDERGTINVSDDLIMSQDIENIEDSIRAMNMYYTHKEEITATQALTSTDPLTNYRDFNADIYVYAGHGSEGNINYEISYIAGVEDDLYPSSSLPNDMQNCQLIVWNCCYSAVGSEDHASLGNVSLANGAKTVIAFSDLIASPCATVFIDILFEELAKGYTVRAAVDTAKVAVTNWGAAHSNPEAVTFASVFNAACTILGDENNIIFPVNSTLVTEINNSINQTSLLLNRGVAQDKRLLAENTAAGVKVYVKMIDNIASDDYYIEYYQNGQLLRTYQSAYTVTASEAKVAAEELKAKKNVISSMLASQDMQVSDLMFKHIDGELHLVYVQSQINPNLVSQIQVIYSVL